MGDYKVVKTSHEVWSVILKNHPEMVVFGNYSAPYGDQFGNQSKAKMFTSYGFPCSDYPVIEAQTTWDISVGEPHERKNVRHEYWICLPNREDE